MFVVIPLILILLTVSIVGVPFMLLGLSLLLPLAICGKAAIFLTLGSTLFSGRLKPLAVIFGYILYFMATALPYIDWITFLVFNTIGIALCLLSGLRMMKTARLALEIRLISPVVANGNLDKKGCSLYAICISGLPNFDHRSSAVDPCAPTAAQKNNHSGRTFLRL